MQDRIAYQGITFDDVWDFTIGAGCDFTRNLCEVIRT
jgi:hypothetical protein